MWSCTSCGESHEPTFDACWKCGTSRAGEAAMDFARAVPDEASALEAPGPALGTCVRCGAARVFPATQIIDHDEGARHPLMVAVDADPDAWVFKDRVTGILKAMICGACGHTELVCDGAGRLLEHYLKREG